MSPFGPLHRTGPEDKYVLRMAALCAVLLLACGGLTLGYLGERHANSATHVASDANDIATRATEAVAGSCQFYRDIAAVPIASTSTKALLTIIADARVAYQIAGCARTKGELPKPDRRILPYLPTEQHLEGSRP